MNALTVRHIIVMPKVILEEDFSFFQGFSRHLFGEYLEIFSVLSRFPHDVSEVFLEGENYVSSKMSGSSLDIIQIKEDLLDEEHVDFGKSFNVLWSTEETFDAAVKVSSRFNYQAIHISTKKNDNTIYIGDLSEEKVSELFISAIKKVIKLHQDSGLVGYLNKLVESKPSKKSPEKLPFIPLGHNCSTPMVSALHAAGYVSDEFEDVIPSPKIDQHVKGIVALSNFVNEVRGKCDLPSYSIKNDVIIFCPSMYTYLYKANSRIWNDLYRKINKQKREFIKNSIIRNKGYSNSMLKLEGEPFNPYDDEILKFLLIDRQSELRLFTDIISIVTANQFCPSVRLPNSVMLHHDMLKVIVSLIKSPNKKRIKKLNNKMRSYSGSIKKDIGGEIVGCAINNKNKLLVFCDFPIEWLSLSGFPLMFTHEISRVPTTPGNLFSQLALSGQRIMIPYGLISEILVLRSFDKNDPIREHLNVALDVFDKKNCYENININFVDVDNVSDIINALNKFSGIIVIFDCHGNHGGENDSGWLNVGGDEINVWSLANKCRIPPIIILSACSTHPVDGSHASVANGFFRCGALSVLGTYAPVNSIHAAQFVARILHRVSAFVPMLIKNRPVTWREVISGFLKMSYTTDVLRGLRYDLKIITDDQYMSIHNKVNFIINTHQADWASGLMSVIEEESSVGVDDIKKIIDEKYQFVETMLFSQLGRPENIVIYNEEFLTKK